ncbi:MAG: hypothetical protein LBR17_09815 [Bacteroidales bacterium]|nr:hypothetical protein [Bacteroidales bacterium]
MKQLALCLFVSAFLLAACTENHDCLCVVNGQEQQYYDNDTNCQELEGNISTAKDLPGSSTSGVACTEM